MRDFAFKKFGSFVFTTIIFTMAKSSSTRKYIVHRYGSTQWTWSAVNSKNGKRVGWAGEGHASRAHTIRMAMEEASGRPVFLEKKGVQTQLQ